MAVGTAPTVLSTRPPGDILVGARSEPVRDELVRLAAAAHVDPVVSDDPVSLRRWWPSAGLVLLDEDGARQLGCAPSRRDGVLLVTMQDGRAAYAAAVAVGAQAVVRLPDDRRHVLDAMTAALQGARRAVTAAVVPGHGGAGASVLLAAVARQAAADGLSVVAVDADPCGADLGLLLDMTDEPGLRWTDLASVQGQLPAAAVAASLPTIDGVHLLAAGPAVHPVGVDAMASVVAALGRVFDLVLVDVPRWLPASAGPALEAADQVLLVTSVDPRGLAGARRTVGRLRREAGGLHVVVRAARGTAVDEDAVERTLGAPLLCQVRDDPRIRADLARGDLRLRPTLRRAARSVLMRLATTAPVATP